MSEVLRRYKETFENYLIESLKTWEKTKLFEACEYALLNGGKRIRPVIVMMVANAIGKKFNVMEACLSVEYFHTASLIADDLPCMDNDDFRRSKPALHKVFGETLALLASYGLITEGFAKIYSSAQVFKRFSTGEDKVCALALEIASRGSGIAGATGGQFLDLFPEKLSLEFIQKVIEKKTITLFEVAFEFGWLFGGGEIKLLPQIKEAAYHLGMAFQIADDLNDLSQDDLHETSPNIGLFLGFENAHAFFMKEIVAFEEKIKKLQIFNLEFAQLIELLIAQASAGSSVGITL